MRITLTLDDEFADQLMITAKKTKKSLEAYIQAQLESFASVSPTDRHLIVHSPALRRIEVALGGHAIASDVELANRLELLSSLSVGSYKLELSPAQLLDVKRRAERMGKPFEAYLDEACKTVGKHLEGMI